MTTETLNLLAADYPGAYGQPLCGTCGRHPATVREEREVRDTFRKTTGLPWPGHACSFRIRKDRLTLDLPTDNVPEWVGLCLPCAVSYMHDFNERLRQHRTGTDAGPLPLPGI